MGYQDDRPTNLSLLLLSADPSWIEAARVEIATMADTVAVLNVASAAEVVRHLAPSGHGFSHLLLQPDLAGDWLATLVGLTAGEESSGVGLVVLGSDTLPPEAPIPPHVRFVPHAVPGWLGRALAAPQRSRRDLVAPDEAELREALSAGRIQARYQPIVRIADRVPVGLEVLARFDHPVHGTVRPDLFVPQIEAAGLAWALTETMLSRAFADWSGNALRQYGLFIAVNFPLDVLLIPQALSLLEQRRAAAGIPANHIVIELTESRPVEHLDDLREAISRLRGLGYGLAIDDVGPDIRDHSALLDLQFTTLKLDKEVVRDAPRRPRAQEFLVATVATARRAGLTVIAEGVETQDIWTRMEAAGVDQAQGFLVARPLPAQAVAPWYEDWCARFTH